VRSVVLAAGKAPVIDPKIEAVRHIWNNRTDAVQQEAKSDS
jgi:hypothetical protein